jgi:hypothetical protein
LKERQAVEEVVQDVDDDDDMEGNDSSQDDEAKPPKKPILQLTEYGKIMNENVICKSLREDLADKQLSRRYAPFVA